MGHALSVVYISQAIEISVHYYSCHAATARGAWNISPSDATRGGHGALGLPSKPQLGVPMPHPGQCFMTPIIFPLILSWAERPAEN